jgi:hypothetical protein
VQAGVDALSAALHALRREPEQVFVASPSQCGWRDKEN